VERTNDSSFRSSPRGTLAESLDMLSIFLAAVLTQDDPELIARLRRRDPSAMTDVYDRYGKLAYSIAYRITRHPETAEDLVQEVFLRLWNRVRDFNSDRGSLAMWVVCLARSRALDHLRSAEWRLRSRQRSDFVIESLCFEDDPTRQIAILQQMQAVKTALGNLNEHERKVLALAYYEGLSQSQIADKLQEPLGTVKTWTRMALMKLRREVAGGE
jgi:RNA polymerase sigma-70 factor (ECF subfamily)